MNTNSSICAKPSQPVISRQPRQFQPVSTFKTGRPGKIPSPNLQATPRLLECMQQKHTTDKCSGFSVRDALLPTFFDVIGVARQIIITGRSHWRHICVTQLRTIGPFPWEPRPFTLNAFNRWNLESSAYLAIAVFRFATSRTVVANMHKIAFTPRLRLHGEGRQRLTDHAVLQRERQTASSDKAHNRIACTSSS